MNLNHPYILAMITIMAVITFALRALPFVVLKNRRFKFIDYLGLMMPPGIMIILIGYSFIPSGEISQFHYPLLIACSLLVITLHHLFRNTLLSILGSTLVYIIAKAYLM